MTYDQAEAWMQAHPYFTIVAVVFFAIAIGARLFSVNVTVNNYGKKEDDA